MMRAMRLHRRGAALSCDQIAIPEPGPRQLLLRSARSRRRAAPPQASDALAALREGKLEGAAVLVP